MKKIVVDCSLVETGGNYRRFKREDLGGLLYSIKRRGLIQYPTLTNGTDKPYKLIAGERRFRCCEILRRPVTAILREDLTEEQIVAIQLAENIKEGINPGELAESSFRLYKELISEKRGLDPSELDVYSPKDLPQEYRRDITLKDFAVIIGRSESTVRDYFAFATLDERVRDLVINGKCEFSKAVLLSRLPQDIQLQEAVNFKGSADDLETRVEALTRNDQGQLVLTTKSVNHYDRSLFDFLNSTSLIIGAGIEYSREVHRFNHSTFAIVNRALDILYKLKAKFEKKAEGEKYLERMLSVAHGNKDYQRFILEKNFGLDDVISEDVGGDLEFIPLSLIDIDREQPRRTYNPVKIKALHESIKEIGLIQPLLVSPCGNGRYIVIEGNRRRLALVGIDMELIPCIVQSMSTVQRRIYQFESDFHEQDRPDERAEAIYRWTRLKEKQYDLDGRKLTKREVAERLKLDRKTVARAFDFVSANKNVRSMYQRGLITYSSVAEISRAPRNAQRELAFKTYLRGRRLENAKDVVNEYIRERRQLKLFPDSSTRTSFTNLFERQLLEYLHNTSLAQLEKGDIHSDTFIRKFYSLIRDMEELKNLTGRYRNR